MNRPFLLALCAALGMASRAVAEPSGVAKPHVDAGVKAYNEGAYALSASEFEIAYGIDPDPVLLYAWAQAQRQGGHCDKALDLYRRYIDSKPTDVQIEAAKTGISLCEQTPALPPVVEPPPPTDVRPWYKDPIGGALVISGVVGLGVGTTFLVLSGRSADAATEPHPRKEFLELLDEATQRRRIGIVGIGLGFGLAAAGVIRYATLRSDKPARVGVTTSGTSVLLFGRF